jgi:hypothetical protein
MRNFSTSTKKELIQFFAKTIAALMYVGTTVFACRSCVEIIQELAQKENTYVLAQCYSNFPNPTLMWNRYVPMYICRPLLSE